MGSALGCWGSGARFESGQKEERLRFSEVKEKECDPIVFKMQNLS